MFYCVFGKHCSPSQAEEEVKARHGYWVIFQNRIYIYGACVVKQALSLNSINPGLILICLHLDLKTASLWLIITNKTNKPHLTPHNALNPPI